MRILVIKEVVFTAEVRSVENSKNSVVVELSVILNARIPERCHTVFIFIILTHELVILRVLVVTIKSSCGRIELLAKQIMTTAKDINNERQERGGRPIIDGIWKEQMAKREDFRKEAIQSSSSSSSQVRCANIGDSSTHHASHVLLLEVTGS